MDGKLHGQLAPTLSQHREGRFLVETIEKMIALEWNMMQDVNAGGPKAECQLSPDAFHGMRWAQFSAWSEDVIHAYYQDLLQAKAMGRNLIAEKYIHMMENIAPDNYLQLSKGILMPSQYQQTLAKRINRYLLAQTAILFQTYPRVCSSARPLYAQDDSMENTSIETYQRGELLTYSVNTLLALEHHLLHLAEQGISLAQLILENSVRYYGYTDLAQAEAAEERRI